MTTASESIDLSDYTPVETDTDENDEIQAVEVTFKKKNALAPTETAQIIDDTDTDPEFDTYSMADQMDRQLLQNIEQYVVQNMSRGQISLEELSATMGMGRVPFFHKIRNITGKTPTELVRDMRLKRACILLKQTNINMNELATNVGFPTGENFIKVFKDKFGISPLEYRLKHRRQE
jgi:AraC-like DNA-binding protein